MEMEQNPLSKLLFAFQRSLMQNAWTKTFLPGIGMNVLVTHYLLWTRALDIWIATDQKTPSLPPALFHMVEESRRRSQMMTVVLGQSRVILFL